METEFTGLHVYFLPICFNLRTRIHVMTARDNEIKRLLAIIDSMNKTIVELNKTIVDLNKTIAGLNESSEEQKEANARLLEANAKLLEAHARQVEVNAKLQAELVSVNNKFEMFFGKKSEKRKKKKPDSKTDETAAAKSGTKKEVNGGGGRNEWPASLPRIETVIDPPEEERVCKACGTPFRLIASDSIEILHFKPMELYVEKQIRNKYIADCLCSETRSVSGDSPIRPVDKGKAGTDIIALMAVMKYLDHLPLSRQATQIFKRAGIDFSESSMCRWMSVVADHLTPLYDLIHKLIRKSFFVKIDASWAKYRSIMTKGRCKQGYIWGFLGDADYPYVWYGFETNGTREGPARVLGDYSGYVQCDAQNIYDRIFMPDDGNMNDPEVLKRLPTEVGCWAHARRKFVDASKVSPEAAEVVKMIGVLYGIEKKSKTLDIETRYTMRQEESLPQLDRIFGRARDEIGRYTDKELIGLAYQYLLNHETPLRRYCEDGRLEIDNNACERALRPISVGRKNWLFFGNERGGKTGTIIFTILRSAKLHGLNEFEYLHDILIRLADLPSEQALYDLLPDRWQKQN